jgi:hypothetical protein
MPEPAGRTAALASTRSTTFFREIQQEDVKRGKLGQAQDLRVTIFESVSVAM